MSDQSVQYGAEAVVREYAQALLELSAALDSAQQVQDEIVALAGLKVDGLKLGEFLANPMLPAHRKQEILDRVLEGKVLPLTRSFLGVLVRNGRGGLLPAVAGAYHHLLDEKAGRIEVQVTSAAALEPDQLDELTAVLKEALQAQPELDVRIDPELLGGLVLMVNDRLLDTSVRGTLDRWRKDLATTRRT